MVGIDGYGGYVPLFRIDRAAIAEQRGGSSSGENAVPGRDENHVTMACEAAEVAFNRSTVSVDEIDAVFATSVTDPFAEHGIAAHVAYHLGAVGDVRTADFRATTRAATDAIAAACSVVRADSKNALVVCTDIMPAIDSDDDETYAGAGAGAVLLGEGLADPAATVQNIGQATTGFTERHRRHGHAAVPGNAGFERGSGFASAVERATERALSNSDRDPTYAIVAAPDERMRSDAPDIVTSAEQMSTFDDIGFAGTATFALDVVQFLEQADDSDTAVSVAYGAGGADVFVLEKGAKRQGGLTIDEQLASKEYVTVTANRANREASGVNGGGSA